MFRSFRLILFLLLVLTVPLSAVISPAGGEEAAGAAPAVARIVVDGPISPVTADYILSHIEQAEEENMTLLVLQLDTPGGLVTSTRKIVKGILSSRVPVAVHVAPPGARAASAGVFITMSGHIAAMAPGTNIGAAHPVNLGGGNPLAPDEKQNPEKRGNEEGDPSTSSGQGNEDKAADQDTEPGTRNPERESEAPASGEDVMGQKILNDTVAFARSIAERQGRNADWAEKAVRESVSVTEKEALKLNVIDVVAEDTRDLLEAIDGRSVKVSGEDIVLSLQNSRIVDRPMKFRHRVLMALSDPNIAYILMMLGIYGLFFELANPGVILPGVVGGIFLILAFFSFHVLSINYAGFLLIFLGIVLFILEVKVVSYGMLSVGGIVSLFLGSMMLFDTGEPYVKLSISIVLAFTLTTALFIVLGLTLVIKSHRKKPTTGVEGMIGEHGVASTDIDNTGKVKVHGEIWSATSTEPIKAGDSVVVKSVERMKLTVAPERDE